NNGFRLSVMDVDNNTPVKFNVKADMGPIHLDNGAGGRIIKQYRRWDNFPVAPERRANPGWAENTVDGDAINLFDILPLFRLNDG
ncbi:hypothetical protein MJI47_29710, partial [Salmonella enterica subsp. enterica serovar Kentucky]|nr:hypothetical protein [Salmonella enterica subsp. enterica serovar Kentucky]